MLSAVYVAATYALMHACLAVLGPFLLTPGAAIEWRAVGYVALAAIAAAVICVGLYVWQFHELLLAHAIALGALALLFQNAYELSQKGWSEFVAMWSEAPLHSVATSFVIAAAIPLVAAFVANYSLKRTAASRHR